MGFLNPRNVGIIGMIALTVFLKNAQDVNFDDYVDQEITAENKQKKSSASQFSQHEIENSRAPASLELSNAGQSTLSSASTKKKNNDFYEDKPLEDVLSEEKEREVYGQAQAETNQNPPTKFINPTTSTEDNINQNPDSSRETGDSRGDFLGGGFTGDENNGAQGPVDTFNFNNVSGENPNTGNNNPPEVSPNCSANRAAGTYIAEISITLTCNQSAQIYYCIGSGGSCCDPVATPTTYTGAFPVGTIDGNYCVSFYGQSTSSLLSSNFQDISYLVDSSLPSLITQFPKTQVQTTELPLLAQTQSVDFGIANHYLHQINTKEHDPTALVWSCADVLSDYSVLAGANPTLLDFNVSGLTPVDQVDQQMEMPSLQYGDNFFTTILEDRDRMLMGCQQENIIVRDFQIFTTTASAPTTSGTSGSFGGFVSFGHFQTVPNATESGSGESVQATQVLEEGFLAITH